MSRLCLLFLLLVTTAHAETFVLCAGVEQYDDGRVSPLKYAVADARAVAAAFRASGVPAGNVKVLTSADPNPTRRPTRIALITALQRIRDVARPGDKVVFFFAGHGIEEGGVQYLLTVDARRDLMAETALPLDLVNKALDRLQAGELLCIIDACRNSPDSARGDEGAQLTEGLIRGVRPRVLPVAADTKPALVATLLSCDVGQRAYEDPQRGHGVFTLQLLAGLTGKAVGADGQVTLSGLTAYVQREVQLWCARTGKEQTPRLVSPDGGDMVLLTPPDEPLVSLDARNSTLADVVADIAEQVGAQVVFGQGADPSAKVSGHLELQPLTKALKVLLLAHGLTVRRVEGTYLIEAPGAQAQPAPPEPQLPQPTPQPTPTVVPNLEGGVPVNGPKPVGWPDYLPWPLPGVSNPDLRFRVAEIDGMPQVLIPAGEFLMGSPEGEEGRRDNEGPQRRIYVSAFWMDLHEVTVRQYKWFCRATGREIDGRNADEQHPVIFVTRDDASAYAEWSGRVLPSEAEWEKAARAGTTTAYPWGDNWDAAAANGGRGLKAVTSFPANAYGLFDVVGNVFEWCRDFYDAEYYARMPARDPVNITVSAFAVIRGGSYSNGQPVRKVAYRGGNPPTKIANIFGFRCAAPAATVTAP